MMSMRWRLLGSFGLIIMIALGTVAVVARFTTQQEVQTFLGHGGRVGVENLVAMLQTYYETNGTWKGAADATLGGQGRGQGRRSGANATLADFILADSEGEILFSPIQEETGTRLSDEDLSQSIPLETSDEVVGYLLPVGGVLDLPEDFETVLIERVNRASLLAAMISGGIAILLGLVLATVILRPVESLTNAAHQMADGDFSQRVRTRGEGELAKLGETFNQMAESLQKAETTRMAMTADIAHELRNPLAIQRAHLEALQDGVYPLSHENLALIEEQNQQLTRLVEDLRTLALADAGELSLNKRQIDLGQVCGETIARFEPQSKAKQIQLTCTIKTDKNFVSADKERLQQIHDNLMQNALRYTPVGGWIALSISDDGKFVTTEFHNNGPNISQESLDHLFTRFYRGDKARDRASGGTGLGLAIARKLAEAHGGTLTGENHPEGGVVFKFYLPN